MAGRLSGSRVLIFIFFILLCICASGLAWLYQAVPQQAVLEFGRPASHLAGFERFSLSLQLLLERDKALTPVDREANPLPFEVVLGESPSLVAARLQTMGVIRDSQILLKYLVYSGLDTGIQAGKYKLSPAMNIIEIAHALQDATPTEVAFAILPGWRLEEIAAALPTSGLEIDQDQFLAAAQQVELSGLPGEWARGKNLEGFLFPDNYVVSRKITAYELILNFTRRFQEQITPDLSEGFSRQGLDVYQAITLASIVQREAVVSEEQPMIASVFVNRMNTGMSLDSDPTIQYALGYNSEKHTWWTNPLSLENLRFDSPYNTYLVAGLPPGPICNPGISAIRAVAYPAQTPYYYFRARCDDSGRHNFSTTFDEHLNFGCP